MHRRAVSGQCWMTGLAAIVRNIACKAVVRGTAVSSLSLAAVAATAAEPPARLTPVVQSSATPRALSEPARLDLTRRTNGRGVFTATRDCPDMGVRPSSLRQAGDEVSVTLNAQWTDPERTSIRNPSAQGDEPIRDRLRVRSYNGCLVGPTIQVQPGQTVRLMLNNALGPEAKETCPDTPDHTRANCYNTTNLHTHGLHVSPVGNSDNVLLEIPPGTAANPVTFPYEFNIPADHPAGTFWYHSHRHGSTAIQVSSGMVGALIVRGSRTAAQRLADGGRPADIDTILRRRDGQPMPERVLVFQQLSYACFDQAGVLMKRGDGSWRCVAGQDGEVRSFEEQIGPNLWDNSGRVTAVNGEVWPRLDGVRAGEVQRWRMVHGGVRDGINLKILRVDVAEALGKLREIVGREGLSPEARTLVDQTVTGARLGGAAAEERLRRILETGVIPGWDAARSAREDLIGRICGDEAPMRQVEIAIDGLTRSTLQEKAVNHLQPGYRSDVLVAFPSSGLYCVLDGAAPSEARLTPPAPGEAVPRRAQRLLMTAMVQPGSNFQVGEGRFRRHAAEAILAANSNLPGAVRQRLAAGSLADYAFTVDYEGTPERPVVQAVERALSYRIGPGPDGALRFGWAASVNPQAPLETYDPATVPFRPVLGTAEGWRLFSTQNHIHHIHVNPFQIMDVLDGQGRSIYGPGGACAQLGTDDSESAILQYCDQQGIHRDTIFIRGVPGGSQGFTIVTRTFYDRYIGTFVLHCHILDHEDRGMMANVEIVPPGITADAPAAVRHASH